METPPKKDFALRKIVCKTHFVVLHCILHPHKITWPQECFDRFLVLQVESHEILPNCPLIVVVVDRMEASTLGNLET